MNQYFSTPPLDPIESYLGNHFITYERVNDTTIRVPRYGNDKDTVELINKCDPQNGTLIIDTDSGVVVEFSRISEVLKYLNAINSDLYLYFFFIDPKTTAIKCRFAHPIAQDVLEADFIHLVLEAALCDSQYFSTPALKIINDGGTAADALRMLDNDESSEKQ